MVYLFLAAVLVASAAAWTDHRTGEIPNRLTFGAMGLGLVGNAAVGFQQDAMAGMGFSVGLSLLGGILNSLPPLMIYRLNPMAVGGGDVKLLIAIGCILGPVLGIEAEFYGFVVAALYAPARMAYHGGLRASLRNVAIVVKNSFRKPAKREQLDETGVMEVRFAPALLAGTLVTVLPSLVRQGMM